MSLFGEKDLLAQHIENADGPSKPIRDENHGIVSGNVEVVFRDIANRVAVEIERYDCAYGCVAWMTNERILDALAGRRDTTIIVQKEDFLRPDAGGPNDARLRKLYSRLVREQDDEGCYQFGYNFLSFIEGLEAVRCVGYATDKNRTIPRMHNKFLVLGDKKYEGDGVEGFHYFEPSTVITGSFNMTENASRSLENIVIIKDATVAEAYYDEFKTIYGISEPLDWKHEYVNPLYSKNYPFSPRYGT